MKMDEMNERAGTLSFSLAVNRIGIKKDFQR